MKLDDASRVGCHDAESAVTCVASAYTHQKCPRTDARASRIFRATPERGLGPLPRPALFKSQYFDIPTPLTLVDVVLGTPSDT